MKLRSGFVSNSSSCSFCIYGSYFESHEIEEITKKLQTDDFESLFENTSLAVEGMGSDFGGGLFVGKYWKRIKDDQTGKQFKQEVEDALKEVLKDSTPISCSTYEEAWYNG